MADHFRQLDEYWQALGGMRSEDRKVIRDQHAADSELMRLFELLDRLDAVREMIVDIGSQEIQRAECPKPNRPRR